MPWMNPSEAFVETLHDLPQLARPGEVWSKLRRAYLDTTASLGVAAL